MKKKTMSNMMQRCVIFCFVAFVAMTMVFTRGNESKAWDEKGSDCTLQSITLEIDGVEHKFEGDLSPFLVVEQDKDWNSLLSSIKVVDFEVVTSDTCTCENHDALIGALWGDDSEEIEESFVMYADGVSTNVLQEDDTFDIGTYGFYDIYFNSKWGHMDIFLTKEYALDYNLEGGAFLEGTEIPDTYASCRPVTLPIPERDGYIFEGWTSDEILIPEIDLQTEYGMSGDVTYTANWTQGERIDITTLIDLEVDYEEEVGYSGEEVYPYVDLYDLGSDEYFDEGSDYVVSYKNNIEIADADSDVPPTIIIRGVGLYKGIIEKTFSITQSALRLSYNYNLSVSKGATLSTVDLSRLRVYAFSNDELIPGTWAWDNPDTVVDEEVGSDEASYKATFTPTDEKHYKVLSEDICLNVKYSMNDCDILFADEETLSYTGDEHEPAVTVVSGDATLEEGVDYSVSYKNNVNAANQSDENAPTVVVKGKGEYLGTKELTFTIEKGDITVAKVPTAAMIEEGEKLSDSALAGGIAVDAYDEEVEGVFSWKDGAIVPTVADSGVTKYKVVFTPQDTKNYESVETDVLITVNKKIEDPKDDPSEEPKDNPKDDPSEESKKDPAQEPNNDTTQTPSTDKGIVVGDKVSDKNNTATYKAVKTQGGKVEVMYVAPNSKKKTVTIPATVTLSDGTTAKVVAVGAKAFKGNGKLQTITIGKNVKTIGKEAFGGCKNLKKVKGATNVTSIGEKTFYNCKALKKITIYKKVNAIGKSAFQGCKSLKTINIKTTKLTKKNVKKNAFKGIYQKAKIDVPNSKKKAYKTMLQSRGVSKKATIK